MDIPRVDKPQLKRLWQMGWLNKKIDTKYSISLKLNDSRDLGDSIHNTH